MCVMRPCHTLIPNPRWQALYEEERDLAAASIIQYLAAMELHLVAA